MEYKPIQLKNENGEYECPITTVNEVFGTDGKPLKDSLITNNLVSDMYDNTKTYAVGDYCIRNNTLYKCITPIETAEDFDPTKWEATNCATEIGALNDSLDLYYRHRDTLVGTINISDLGVGFFGTGSSGITIVLEDATEIFIPRYSGLFKPSEKTLVGSYYLRYAVEFLVAFYDPLTKAYKSVTFNS